MKSKTSKTIWNFAGLFIMMLVLSMPFYSASAMAAAVQITKNSGEEGVETYLDAEGDVWTVETLISDSTALNNGTVNPADVKIKIGDSEAPFSSCTKSALGNLCEYISPLTDGVQEGEYAFQVIYSALNAFGKTETASNGDVIRADGSAPAIFFAPGDVKQTSAGEVELDFTVNDKVSSGAPSVGLKQVDILDADTGLVYQSITVEGQEEFNYILDSELGGILDADWSGEGLKRIKIRAEDRLGHKAVSQSVSFFADFVKPEIGSSLNFTQFGQFIGQFTGTTDIVVDITESSVPTVKGYSDQANFNGQEAVCEADDDVDKLWHCTWNNIEVKPQSSITVLIVAEDEKGNTAERSIVTSFTVDSSPPEIKFFGTLRQFEDKSYMKSGESRIILRAEDQGAGISKEGIRANLGAFDLGSAAEPTACEEAAGVIECYWEIDDNLAEGVQTFGLSTFEDNVGNEGVAPEFEFLVDNTGPKVEELEVFGVSEAGDKNYFQSNDLFKIVLKVSEASGLRVLVDVNDLVLDAETKYPENYTGINYVDEEGWQVFTEDDCQKVEGRWECMVQTDSIKSGPDSNVEVEIKVQDTAGNDAVSWPEIDDEPKNVKRFKTDDNKAELTIDLLGLATEDNPDYWEVQSVLAVGGAGSFIDLDTAPLTYTRLPFKIVLNSDLDNVQALNIELASCAPKEAEKQGEEAPVSSTAPAISRSLLYGGTSPTGDYTPAPNVIIEFEPFDGRGLFNIQEFAEGEFKHQEPYTCTLKIFSQVGKNAIRAAEIQEVEVLVPFAFSSLGAQDENLEKIIEDAKDDINAAWDVIGVMAEILKWVDYLVQIYRIIVSIIEIVEGPSKYSSEALKEAPGGEAARIAFCFGMTGATEGVDNGVNIIDQIVQVLSCSPRGKADLGWYGQWQSFILSLYNVEVLNFEAVGNPDLVGSGQYRPARDIRENLYLSIAGLCIPGIIKNLDEIRQIKCRKIVCLQNEVRSGVATVAMCEDLEDLLMCKYVLGELWYILPFSQFYDTVINALYKAFGDPFAIAHTVTILTCGIYCTTSSTVSGACTYAYFIWDIIGTLESIVGFVTTIVAEFESGGLNYCDAADVDVI
ncbi:hypothetical protein HYV87_00075 [Candidatus Woesearchaeota archaeon]|nr:hypothetical protein [Candidatus Woesearchaeota archaeon]